MRKNKIIKLMNTNGFSLVEMMVGVAISSAFVLMAASIVKDISTLTNKDKNQLSSETDISFAMGYLSRVFRDAGPSFNNIKGNLDINGKELFDQISDTSTVGWSEKDVTRTLTLSPLLNRFEVSFLVNDSSQVDQVFYDPVKAYSVGGPVESMEASSTLTYLSLNNANIIGKYAPNVWKQGNLLMLRTPIPLRFVAANGAVVMSTPPREHTFLGVVNGDELKLDAFGGHTYGTHPVNNRSVPTADNFLRTIPTVGGASPIVEVFAVKGVKLELKKNATLDQYDLYSSVYSNGAFINPFLIAPKVKSVTFKREFVGLPLISVKLIVDK